MSVSKAVERLWPGRDASLEVLGGGITNHNVKVDVDGGPPTCCASPGQDTDLLGIDRRRRARGDPRGGRGSVSGRRWSPSSSRRAGS